MMILGSLAGFWAACGLCAFATYFARTANDREVDWVELPVQLVCAILLGAIALIGVLTNEDRR